GRRSAEDGRQGSMKPERGDGGVTRGMMGKNLVAQGTQFDPEGSPHAPAEATEAANRRRPPHGGYADARVRARCANIQLSTKAKAEGGKSVTCSAQPTPTS